MKRILLLVLLTIAPIGMAVPMSGTYTIGATASDYTSVTAAVQALTANGVSGAVIFNIKSGTYTGSYNLSLVAGSSNTNTITFQSLTGNADDVIMQKTSGSVFSVSGKHYRFRNLKLELSTGVLEVRNGIILESSSCEDIVIANCNFTGNALTTSAFYNANADSKQKYTHLILNGSNITVDGNFFSNANSAIYRHDNYNFADSENIFITNNTFQGTFVTLAEINRTSNLIFSGNQNSGVVKYHTLKALWIGGSSQIAGNRFISGNEDLLASQPAIYLSGVSTANSTLNFQNNFVATASHVLVNLFTNFNIFHNSFRAGNSFCLLLENYANLQHCDIYNNIFSTQNHYAGIRYTQALPLSKVGMNNNAYNKEIRAVQYYTQYIDESNYYDLQAWKTFAARDQNSPVVDDVFVSATDLHTPNAIMLNGAGSLLPNLAADIDGQSRNAAPDIGADEFDMDMSTYRDLELVNVVSPTASGCGLSPVVLSLKNNSIFPVTQFTIECSLNGFRGNLTPYTQTINAGQTVQVTLNSCEIVKNTFYEKFDFYVSQPNNLLDNNYANNKISISNILQLGSFQILDEGNICNNQHKLYIPKIGNATVLWSTGATTNNIAVTQPGTYSATVTAPNGCSVTQTININ